MKIKNSALIFFNINRASELTKLIRRYVYFPRAVFTPGGTALPQGPQNSLELGHRQEHLPRRGDDPEGTFRR
jgi:hypothetical protein